MSETKLFPADLIKHLIGVKQQDKPIQAYPNWRVESSRVVFGGRVHQGEMVLHDSEEDAYWQVRFDLNLPRDPITGLVPYDGKLVPAESIVDELEGVRLYEAERTYVILLTKEEWEAENG